MYISIAAVGLRPIDFVYICTGPPHAVEYVCSICVNKSITGCYHPPTNLEAIG